MTTLGDSEYSQSRSLRGSSHYCLTTCSFGHFKIICPDDSVWEVENAESRNLLGSSLPNSRTEKPLYWNLSRVAKKNWGWAGCDGTHDYRWWKLDSPLRSSHKTQKNTLGVFTVSSKEKSLSGEIDGYGYAHFVLWCVRSSLSAYCPSSYDNSCTVLLRSFKNLEETCEQDEAWSENNLAFTPQQCYTTHYFHRQIIWSFNVLFLFFQFYAWWVM